MNMSNNKDRWYSLSMKDRAGLIKLYVNNGITDISTIKNHYNKFSTGGNTNTGNSDSPKNRLYDPNKTTSKGELYKDIIDDRVSQVWETLRNKGYSLEESYRLAPILASQSFKEAGYIKYDNKHNYAGYLTPKGQKLKYNTPEEFWDNHIDNLNKRWPNWSEATDTNEYYDIINNSHLNLNTKKKFKAYNRKNKDNPVYIYAPEWENKRYKKDLNSVYDRVKAYTDNSSNPIFQTDNSEQRRLEHTLFDILLESVNQNTQINLQN